MTSRRYCQTRVRVRVRTRVRARVRLALRLRLRHRSRFQCLRFHKVVQTIVRHHKPSLLPPPTPGSAVLGLGLGVRRKSAGKGRVRLQGFGARVR